MRLAALIRRSVCTPAVELYTRAGCTLCDDAAAVLASVSTEAPHELTLVDITAAGNERWLRAYSLDIPVLHVNGSYWARQCVPVPSPLPRFADGGERSRITPQRATRDLRAAARGELRPRAFPGASV